MATTIQCPSCTRPLNVPDELLGKGVQCPACGLIFVLPGTGAQAQPPLGPPPTVIPVEESGEPEGRERAMLAPDERLTYRPLGPSPGSEPRAWPIEEDQFQQAKNLVIGPGIGLLVTGILGLLIDLGQVAVAALAKPEDFAGGLALGEFWQESLKGATSPEAAVLGAVFAAVSLMIIIGAVQMLRKKTYPLTLVASVLAMINFVNCCCLPGLPLGIWSLVVLSKPEVKSAFEQNRTLD